MTVQKTKKGELANWGVDSSMTAIPFDAMRAEALRGGSTLREARLLNRSNDGKRKLVGKPFVITGIAVKVGAYGNPVARVSAITESNTPIVFHDGSTGVFRQLVDETTGELNVKLPLYVPGGLRVSDYDHPEHGPASTFYLSGDQDLATL